MAKNGNGPRVTLAEAGEKLELAINLTKLFTGFKIPANIDGDIRAAAVEVRRGHEREAIAMLHGTEYGVRCLLVGFFRHSPEHFGKKLAKLEELGADQHLRDKVSKEIRLLEEYITSHSEIDLAEAAVEYCRVMDATNWATDEFQKLMAKRKEKEEEERRKQAEAQRALEQQRRNEAAAGIEGLADLLS